MITPTQDFQKTHVVIPEKLPKGLDALAHSLYGRLKRCFTRCSGLEKKALAVETLAEPLRDCSPGKLRQILRTHQSLMRRERTWDSGRFVDALPAITEAAYRKLRLRPYRVQIMGAIALSRGMLTEMATGEGKTLTIALTGVPSAWTRHPCHIITANDYLAKRDAKTLEPFYTFCGVSVGYVVAKMSPQERREQYAKDIVYTTAKEILADFLRDRLQMGPLQNASRRMIRTLLYSGSILRDRLVMRGIHTAIVDEADNLLIDEAVTPLIISQTRENKPLAQACLAAREVARHLERGRDYILRPKYKEVELKKEADDKIASSAMRENDSYHRATWMRELVEQALTAEEFFKRDKQYVLNDDKVIIVDEFTGRLMPGRSWRLGLHQAIEAKEGIPLTPPTESLARLSFQRFFRFFENLSGITGTAREAADEFWSVYNLPFVSIPTNRPCIRKEFASCIFLDSLSKWKAIVEEIVAIHWLGRPILVGTRSVAASEHLAQKLSEKGLTYRLLNARHVHEEALIVALAGQPEAITIATNMAGRGTDIKLGQGVSKAGGLHVIATEWHESHRIDRQLCGRAARQGDPGSVQVYASLEDELMVRFFPAWGRYFLRFVFRNKLPGARWMVIAAFLWAQRAAGRLAYRQRKNVMKQDTWIDDTFSSTNFEIGT